MNQAATYPVVYSNGPFDPPILCRRLGDEALLDLDAAKRLGWDVKRRGDSATIKAAQKEFESFVRSVDGVPSLPVRAIVSLLNGISEWTADGLVVYSKVLSISVQRDRVVVGCSLPLNAKTVIVSDPPRVVVDLKNARIDSSVSTDGSVRFSQFSNDTVRVVVQTDVLASDARIEDNAPGVAVCWTRAKSVPADPYKPPPAYLEPMAVSSPHNPDELPPASASLPLRLGAPRLEKDSESEIVIAIPYFGKTLGSPVIGHDESGAYVVDFSEAGLLAPNQIQVMNGQFVRSLSLTRTRDGARLRMDFSRLMIPSVAAAAGEIVVRAKPPKTAASGIKNLFVVIDPRRGGADAGQTFSIGGADYKESEIDLEIAKLTADELSGAGAKPILTRTQDESLTEKERTVFANVKKGALLISIGASTEFSNAVVRYDPSSSLGRALAECIASKLDGCEIRTMDAYLLRQSVMPAVIVTFGNLKDDSTRKIISDFDNRKAIARKIAAGIIAFAKGDRT